MERKSSERMFVRIAGAIRDQLVALKTSRLGEIATRTKRIFADLDQLNAVSRKLDWCVVNQRLASGIRVADQALRIVGSFSYAADELEKAVDGFKVHVPSLRDLFPEVVQAREEFGELQYDRKEQTLSVVTEPIELEGVYLGDFQVELHLPTLGEGRLTGAYRVTALDPHPASCDDSVTHPHVRDERLCSGEATAAIHQALASGRICDFFMLVRSVLTNYNSGSPYVALDAWDGIPCYDCGYRVGADEVYFCSGCEHDFCEECSSYCRACEEPFCHGCLQECPACGDLFCGSCIMTCAGCGRLICQSCLEEGECPCHEEEDSHEPKANEVREQIAIGRITGGRDITR